MRHVKEWLQVVCPGDAGMRPLPFGTDAEDACPEPWTANDKRPHCSETGHYSLPMTKPDAGICSHVRPSPS